MWHEAVIIISLKDHQSTLHSRNEETKRMRLNAYMNVKEGAKGGNYKE